MSDDDRRGRDKDWSLALMMRIDPERLKVLRRAMSGNTRCPRCNEINRADTKACRKCGAALYPEFEDEAEPKRRKR